MFVVHTWNCHGQNCTRRAIYRLGINTLIANILVSFIFIFIQFRHNGRNNTAQYYRKFMTEKKTSK